MDGRAVPLCESDGQIAAVGRRGMLWFQLVPAMGPWEAVLVETGVPEFLQLGVVWLSLSGTQGGVDCSGGGGVVGMKWCLR